MKQLCVIGIGAGDPEYITVQAINALNRVDVFFMIDKGEANDELNRLRTEICDRYITDASSYRVVHVADPTRDRTATSYANAVEAWRDERTALYERLIDDELGEGETGSFLVWGDPSLYDGTLLMLDAILRRGRVEFDYEVIPGISSISALAARHRIPLNRVGETIHITPARRLDTTLPNGADNVLVMLDGAGAFTQVADDAVDIYWAAYLGTDDEILISGPLHERCAEITQVRDAAKRRKGWMFDTYLLRRRIAE